LGQTSPLAVDAAGSGALLGAILRLQSRWFTSTPRQPLNAFLPTSQTVSKHPLSVEVAEQSE